MWLPVPGSPVLDLSIRLARAARSLDLVISELINGCLQQRVRIVATGRTRAAFEDKSTGGMDSCGHGHVSYPPVQISFLELLGRLPRPSIFLGQG